MTGQRRAPLSPELIHRRALSIARVLDFPPGTFAGRDERAYLIMSHLAAMPTIGDKSRRHSYGTEVLQNANTLMPDSQPQNRHFNFLLRSHVALMQELPAWYTALTKSNTAIVEDYLNLKLITGGMELAGMGSLGVAAVTSGAATSGIAAAKNVSGARQAVNAFARGAATGARNTVTGGMAGGMAIIWVVGSVAYVALQARMTELGHEITRRYQAHSLPAALYQKAFGEDVPMPEQFPGRAR